MIGKKKNQKPQECYWILLILISKSSQTNKNMKGETSDKKGGGEKRLSLLSISFHFIREIEVDA